MDVAALTEMKLDELPEATGVVVVNRFGVSERLHNRTVEKREQNSYFSDFLITSCIFSLYSTTVSMITSARMTCSVRWLARRRWFSPEPPMNCGS